MTIVLSVAYGALVFLGMAGLGFVVAPVIGLASGVFEIDVEARAFFSLLTLRSVPYLFALGTLSAFAYPRLRTLPLPLRFAAFVSNVLVAYVAGAGIGALSLVSA